LAGDIVVFTLHKSASMFLHRQCEWLTRLAGIPYHSPNLPGSGLDARRLLSDATIWRTRHGCFAPLRFWVDLPQFDNYQVILHLRDPRDVLVSMFYSYCYIHAGEIPADTGYRHEVAARGIDEFVLTKSSARSAEIRGDYGTGGHVEDLIGNLPARYRNYIDKLVGRPNVTLLKYEEMVTDYPRWLAKFMAPFSLDDADRVRAALIERSAEFFPSRGEDAMTHVRHVTPGDHKSKLKAATLQRLDDIYADTLEVLGYARSAE
jgi:hypothetical protein